MSGSLLDETLSLDGSIDVVFTLADITSGFSFLLFETDDPGDQTPSTFDHNVLLEVGHTYRLGLAAGVAALGVLRRRN